MIETKKILGPVLENILRQYVLPYLNKLECLLLSLTPTLAYHIQAILEPTGVEPLTELLSKYRLPF